MRGFIQNRYAMRERQCRDSVARQVNRPSTDPGAKSSLGRSEEICNFSPI